jgi:hypothetical protein
MWIGFIWLRIRISGGLFVKAVVNLCVHKGRRICQLPDRLLAQRIETVHDCEVYSGGYIQLGDQELATARNA